MAVMRLLPLFSTKSLEIVQMDIELNQSNKQFVWDFWKRLEIANTEQVFDVMVSIMDRDITSYGPDPINNIKGVEALVSDYWLPLLNSFPDLTRQTHIFCGGQSNGQADGDISKDGKMWVSGAGCFSATFTKDYLTIPATGSKVNIRWGEFHHIKNGKVVDFYFLLDLVDLMQQAGFNVLPPSLGIDNLFPPPMAKDGILHEIQDQDVTIQELERIRSFIYDSLNNYNHEDLGSMGVADFFHPEVNWYGPGGIGACMSLKKFENFHQKPWLNAFPNRQTEDLDSLFAEGLYTAASGWANTRALHTGEYKGVAATGNALEFNGMDWWKSDGEKYIENWVFVDMIFLFRQFGVDLFERLAT